MFLMIRVASFAIASVLAISSVAAVFSAAEAGDRSLKAKDIRGLFPGKYEARVQGYKVVIHARGNGALAGAAFNRTDKGRWWVKGNRLCVSWSTGPAEKPHAAALNAQVTGMSVIRSLATQ